MAIKESLAVRLKYLYENEDIEKIINMLLADLLADKDHSIEDFFGKVEFFDDYDYKKMRSRNESIG